MKPLVTILSFLVVFALVPRIHAAQQEDELAIRSVFANFSAIWNQPGMPGFEGLFTEDADFVVITGRRLTGRSEIITYHRELLNSRYKGSRSQPMKVESLRFLRPDIAIAHVASGASYLHDGKELTRTGRATATLVKKDGKWLITTFHNTLTSGPGALVPSSVESANSDAEKEVIMLQNEWAAARIKGDVEFLEKLYAKEFRITAMNGSVVERDTDIAAFASRAMKPESITDEDMRVSIYGDVAVVTGLEKVKGTYKGVFGEFGLRFTNVFVRRDGHWQLVTHHSTPTRTN